MVLAAERPPYLGERGVGELAGEVHRDLPGEGDRLGPVLGAHVAELDPEELGDFPLDMLDRDDLLVLTPEVGEDLLGELHAHLAAAERAERDHAGERPLDLADVGLDATGDEIGHVIGKPDPLDLGLLLEDRHPGLEVGGLDVGDEAPLEAGAQALLDLRDLLGSGVGGDDDLLPGLVEIVEGVEELLLGALFARDELDVVDEEEIDGAVLGPELRGAIVADGVDEIVREALGGEIEQAKGWVETRDLVTDRVQEMRLAETDAAVDEERVVRLRRE